MKKILVVMLVLLLTVGLTACSGKESSSGTNGNAPAGETADNDSDALWFVGKWVPVGDALGGVRLFSEYRAELEDQLKNNTNFSQEKYDEEIARIDLKESMYFLFDIDEEELNAYAPTAKMTGMYVPTGVPIEPSSREKTPVLHEGADTKHMALESDGGLRLGQDNVHAYRSETKFPDHPGYMIITLGYSGINNLVLEKVEN